MQTFANHRRYNPIYHYFAAPLCYITGIWAVARWMGTPNLDNALLAIGGLGLAGLTLAAREQVLTVQNRLIRLEMRLRLERVLPADLAARAHELRVRHLIALRFASDAELPDLVQRSLAGEFATPSDIKRAIRNWNPDYLRA
jgi:hypothetical protein